MHALILLLASTQHVWISEPGAAPSLLGAPAAPSLAVAAWPPGDQTTRGDAPGMRRRVSSALWSAALGAGVGFFVSHVASSDWEDAGGGDRPNRQLWAVAGGSVGLTLGFSFPGFGRAASSRAGTVRPSATRRSITAQQIRQASLTDAFEAVRTYRPEWLVERPPDILGQTAEETVRVYLDEQFLGHASSLRQVNALTIVEIRYVEGPAATLRWGVGNSYGVIQVLTGELAPGRDPGASP